MIGTIANTAAILIGSLVGSIIKQGLKEKYQVALYTAMGLAATGLGIHAVVVNMEGSLYPVLFIASLALGGLLGTALDIEGRFDRLVDRKPKEKRSRRKKHTSADALAATASTLTTAAAGAEALAEAPKTDQAPEAPKSRAGSASEGLSTAIVLFCFGTLSILGPINSALLGDETYLLTNATLDLVTSLVLASSYGLIIGVAAAVLFLWQGSIFLLAQQLSPLLTPELMGEISIVGGFLILASGLSILEIKKISVMNFLPALLVPPLWFALLNFLPLA